VTDNLIVTSADFGQFSVTAPSDSRPAQRRGLSRVWTVRREPRLWRRTNTLSTFNDLLATNPLQYQRYNGVTLDVSARPRQGLLFQGGINSGKTVTDNCAVRTTLPEIDPLNPYCHNEPGFITRWS
jgi:hypothetical protein